MAHPTITRKINGTLFHLEDSKLKKPEAKALAKHLRKTEEKKARIVKGDGWEVWWAKG